VRESLCWPFGSRSAAAAPEPLAPSWSGAAGAGWRRQRPVGACGRIHRGSGCWWLTKGCRGRVIGTRGLRSRWRWTLGGPRVAGLMASAEEERVIACLCGWATVGEVPWRPPVSHWVFGWAAQAAAQLARACDWQGEEEPKVSGRRRAPFGFCSGGSYVLRGAAVAGASSPSAPEPGSSSAG
jgi:hypothetical protein